MHVVNTLVVLIETLILWGLRIAVNRFEILDTFIYLSLCLNFYYAQR